MVSNNRRSIFKNSENSKNDNKNNQIIAAATINDDDARRDMVGGYSSTLDVDLPEIKHFVLEEFIGHDHDVSPTTRGENDEKKRQRWSLLLHTG